jgi:hypothetical protein
VVVTRPLYRSQLVADQLRTLDQSEHLLSRHLPIQGRHAAIGAGDQLVGVDVAQGGPKGVRDVLGGLDGVARDVDGADHDPLSAQEFQDLDGDP